MLKIATWNVNSLRVRLPQVIKWLQHHTPDILALQETKVTDNLFPSEDFNKLGYHALFAGQKSYNGVALISRHQGSEVITELPTFPDPQRRVLGTTYGSLRVLNLYVPNGMTIGSDKYQYKLSWLKQLHDYISTQQCYYSQLIVLGDFNIAPTDKDLYNPKAWEGNILVSPAERNAFQALINLGLYDTFRQFEQPPASFSWWDYRADAFQRNHGVRIDFILASQTLINTCTSCLIDTQPRNSERPSDHAPVLATFNI